VACGVSVLFGCTTMLLFWVLPGPIVSAFLDPNAADAEAVLAVGIALMFVAGLFQVCDGLQVTALGLLRGLQQTRVPMFIAIISYWGLGLPCSYVLGFTLGWGGTGIWLGLVFGLMLAAGLLLNLFWKQDLAAVQTA